jgi:hypothetical protein
MVLRRSFGDAQCAQRVDRGTDADAVAILLEALERLDARRELDCDGSEGAEEIWVERERE